jgi:hypothetical protein
MTKTYEQWTPEPQDPYDDPLANQVGVRETERVIADPEVDAPPVIVKVGSTPQPVLTTIDHRVPYDPNEGHVERIELTGHLERPAPSTDRFSDDTLDREAGE